jgi:hypothetical protein
MNRLLWLLRRIQAAIGWQGLAGAALLACCAMVWLLALVPMEGKVASLRQEAAARHESRYRPARVEAREDPAAQLRQFYAFFTRDETLEGWLERLYDIGNSGGLLLRQAEYQVTDSGSLKLRRYRIVVPVTGTYPQLKHFLATTLAEIPILSLDQVSLRKRKAGDPSVDANLQFTLYLLQKS